MVVRDLSALGAAPAVFGLSVLLFLLGFPSLALRVFVGLVLGFVIIFPIRLLYFKDRPKKQKYVSLLERIDASSFPSLHAFRAVLVAVLLSFYSWVFLPVMILYAGVVCWSRIFLQKHDWVDVFVGGLLGGFVALLLQ